MAVAVTTIERSDHGHAPTRRPGLGAWLVFVPMALFFAAFVVVPNLLMVGCGFLSRTDSGAIAFEFSTEGYRRVFEPVWLKILGISAGYAGIATAATLVVAFPAAWKIGRAKPEHRSIWITLVMIPFWSSFLIRAYGWISILREEGLLNAFLKSAHLIDGPTELLYTPTAVVIGLVHSYLPFMILPIYGSVEKIDAALLEAAADLGARPLAIFRHVVWPLVRPGVWAGFLLVFVPAIGMFAVTDLLGGARVPMIGNVIQNQFGAARHWPFGAALGTVLLLAFGGLFYALGTKRSAA